jgi:hypothetical protein
LASALREAEFLRLPVEDRFDLDHARTDLETQMLALCRRHRLPKPAVNVRVDRYVVDFLWTDRLLLVEVDGWSPIAPDPRSKRIARVTPGSRFSATRWSASPGAGDP